ncbi:MAG: hypothetical protein AAGE52_24535 [Myxococcota bacterium]
MSFSEARRRRLTRRLQAFVALLAITLSANNLLPYLGLRDDSCQTMFSSLHWSDEGNNHLYMPQHMVSDIWSGYVDVSATLDPPPEGYGRVKDLHDWLSQENRVLNTEAVRVVVRQICDRGHAVALRYRRSPEGPLEEAANACGEPTLSEPHWWVPIRLYETDYAR